MAAVYFATRPAVPATAIPGPDPRLGFNANAGLHLIVSQAPRLRHPSVTEYLNVDAAKGQVENSDRIAGNAHRSALEDLDVNLSRDERERLQQSSSIQGVYRIVDEARMKFDRNSEPRNKVDRFASTLNHYASSIDVICQQHAEWSSLIWGSMRFILQVSLNYGALFSGIATTLSKIGDTLGRLDMYIHVYPMDRMKNFCARLYAVIITFFKNAIIFYKKSRWRRLIAAINSPFEVKFGGVVTEIDWLVNTMEKEALAMGLASMERNFSALAEWGLAIDQQIQILTGNLSIERLLDVVLMTIGITSSGMTTLLSELRTRLFHGHDLDATFHEEVINRYQLTSNPDWHTWFDEERKHVSWGHSAQSTLTYMQTDLVEPQLFIKWIALGRALAGRAPFAVLVWSPSMTSRSALASLLFQVLSQRPDILQRRSAAFCLGEFVGVATFEDLWHVFRQVLADLPGFLCYITIPSIGPHEESFAARIVDLFNNWSGCPINLQLVTPVHGSFPKPSGLIDIDAMYDVAPELDSPDSLHQVVLAELGFPTFPSVQLRESLWQSVWRTVCYSVNALAVGVLRTAIIDCLSTTSPCSFKSWLQSPAGEFHLENTQLPPCLDRLSFLLPEDSKKRFEATLQDTLRSHLGKKDWVLPADMDARKDRPGRFRARQELWESMKSVLTRQGNIEFQPFAQEVAACVARMDLGIERAADRGMKQEFECVMNEVCVGSEWKATCRRAGNVYREAVEAAIDMGLRRTLDCILE